MALASSPRSFRPLVGVLALALAACGDPTEIRPQFETIETTITVFALSGTPAWAPAGITIGDFPAAVRIGPEYAFDLALDFEGGVPTLYPVQLIASEVVIGSQRRVGVQKVTGTTYDDLLRAPTNGYTFDEPITLAVGDVGVIEAQNHLVCTQSFTFPRTIYAKFLVEAVDPATRSVRLKVLTDPNCGFRGFEDGLPTR